MRRANCLRFPGDFFGAAIFENQRTGAHRGAGEACDHFARVERAAGNFSSRRCKVPESSQAMGESARPCWRAISQAPPSERSHSHFERARIFGKPASTSPRPGLSPAAVSPRTMPPVRPLAPWPMRPASKTATDNLGSRRRSQAAAARPVKPPPRMAMSTDFGRGFDGGRKFTRQGGVPQCTVLADLFPAWRMAGSGVCFGTAGVSAGSFLCPKVRCVLETMERRACGQSLFFFCARKSRQGTPAVRERARAMQICLRRRSMLAVDEAARRVPAPCFLLRSQDAGLKATATKCSPSNFPACA